MRYRRTPLIHLLFLIIAVHANAQPPWRAKLFVHFLDSNNQIVTDTVWFGCDSLGDIGYQPGLDVIDTNLQWNKVYSADDLVKTQYNTDCANLKTNIIGFKKKESAFKFYAIGKPISMSWDTMDFRYFDSTYRLSYIEIKPKNGSVVAADGKYYVIAADNYYIIGGQYIYDNFYMHNDSIRLFSESLLSGCQFSQQIFSFDINIYLGWGWAIGTIDLGDFELLKIYQNPFADKLIIESKMNGKEYYFTIITLQCIEQTTGIIINDKQEIDTRQMSPGIYFMFITDRKSFISKPYKLIKL